MDALCWVRNKTKCLKNKKKIHVFDFVTYKKNAFNTVCHEDVINSFVGVGFQPYLNTFKEFCNKSISNVSKHMLTKSSTLVFFRPRSLPFWLLVVNSIFNLTLLPHSFLVTFADDIFLFMVQGTSIFAR